MDYLIIGIVYLFAALLILWGLSVQHRIKRLLDAQRPKRTRNPSVHVLCHVCRGQRFTDDNRLCPACEGSGCILREKRDRGIAKLIRDLRLKSIWKA